VSLAAGTRLGPYEIIAPIGAGGMGEVYRARDTRLGRDVAVKVLPESVAADPDRRRRFEKEAHAASALNHPAIVTIHDIGTEGGILYVVFELLDGSTLRARLAEGPLPPSTAIDWAIQIARGLAAAHEKRIVHRDLKPENIVATRDGRVKILDFGIARVLQKDGDDAGSSTAAPTSTGATEPGVILGTIGYMSPEQVRGRAVDHRTDIFTFGAILYEMLCGRRAFSGDSDADVLTAILKDDPLTAPGTGRLPDASARVIRRCLEKDPERRFQHARDLEFALETLSAPPREQEEAGEGRRRSIAVLPFKDLAGSAAESQLGMGLADSAITELALVQSLLVRPTAAILKYRNRPADPQEAGRELAVDAVLDGSFQSAGSRLRVTVQLIETKSGRPLWGTKIDASLEDVFAMQDEVSRRIAEALQVRLTPSDERRLAGAARPVAAPAHELYLKGRFLLFSETRLPAVTSAIECFEKALALDPDSSLAMIGLADAWARMAFSFDPDGGWYEKAEALTDRALSAAPGLPEGHYLRGRMLWSPQRNFDHAGAMREFFAAIAASPSLGEAHHFLALLLLHIGLLEESQRAGEQALAIYPDDLATQHIGLVRLLQGRYDEGREISEEALARVSSTWTYYQLAQCQIRMGRSAQAALTTERAAREYPGHVLVFSMRGLLAALAGEAEKAREHAAAVEGHKKSFGHYHHAEYDLACIHALLGEPRQAVAMLRESARNGFPCLPFFEIDPFLETARKTEDYARLRPELSKDHEAYRRLYTSLVQARDPSGLVA